MYDNDVEPHILLFKHFTISKDRSELQIQTKPTSLTLGKKAISRQKKFLVTPTVSRLPYSLNVNHNKAYAVPMTLP